MNTFILCICQIVVFEMLNVLLAMRVWGKLWTDRRVLIWCDNRVVVDVIRGGKTRDSKLGAIFREILMAQAMFNMQLLVQHVKGECNEIADALSRAHMIKSIECK